MERTEQLQNAIEKLSGRIEHLVEQAKAVEQGSMDTKKRFDAEDALVGREESFKVSHSSAVAYWKEVREAEKRLDELCAELRELTESHDTRLDVHVHFDANAEPVTRNA